jgi:hypothetical protein
MDANRMGGRRRRQYSAEFKADLVTACKRPGPGSGHRPLHPRTRRRARSWGAAVLDRLCRYTFSFVGSRPNVRQTLSRLSQVCRASKINNMMAPLPTDFIPKNSYFGDRVGPAGAMHAAHSNAKGAQSVARCRRVQPILASAVHNAAGHHLVGAERSEAQHRPCLGFASSLSVRLLASRQIRKAKTSP